MVVDAVAGVLLAAAIWCVGYFRVNTAVTFVNENRLAGWLLVGLGGPFLANRLFYGSMFQDAFKGWIFDEGKEPSSRMRGDQTRPGGSTNARSARQIWAVRREAVHQLRAKNWIIVQTILKRRSDRYRRISLGHVGSFDASLLELPQTVRRAATALSGAKNHDRYMAPAVVTALEKVEQSRHDKTSEKHFDLLESLIESLIQSQFWEPLDVVFELDQ